MNLLPGFPIEENNVLRVAFYILLPSGIAGGAVIPVDALLQAVNSSKSELEATLGVVIAEIKKGPEPTNPPTSPTSNATTITSSPSSSEAVTQSATIKVAESATIKVAEEANDDWKYIVVGVIVGALIIAILGGVIFYV